MEPSLIRILKTLSSETRLRILNLLQYGDLCVGEIQTLLDVSQSNVSKHLNKLTWTGMLNYYQAAKYVYYQINPDIFKKHPFLKEILFSETQKINQFEKDREKLDQYKKSGCSCDDLKKGRVSFS